MRASNRVFGVGRDLAILAILGLILWPASYVRADASLELYGTFHAMGVIVTIGASDDPDGDATANVAYRVSGGGAYRQGFPLSRVESRAALTPAPTSRPATMPSS